MCIDAVKLRRQMTPLLIVDPSRYVVIFEKVNASCYDVNFLQCLASNAKG